MRFGIWCDSCGWLRGIMGGKYLYDSAIEAKTAADGFNENAPAGCKYTVRAYWG